MRHPILGRPPLVAAPPMDPPTFARYAEPFAAEIDYAAPVEAALLRIPAAAFAAMVSRAETLIQAIMLPSVQARSVPPRFFLDCPPVRPEGFLGCIDFHVTGEEARLIEFSFGPPGRVGMFNLWESRYWAFAGLPPEARFNQDYEDALIAAVTGGGVHRSVGVVTSPLRSSDRVRYSYRYMAELLRRRGIEAEVAVPEDLSPGGAGRPLVRGRPVDVLFNLAIVSRWRDFPESFEPLTRVYAAHRDRFFPNPGMFPMGNKDLMADLYAHAHRSAPGLSADQWRELRHILLPTIRLSDVDSLPELYRFLGSDRVVLKPLDGDNAVGVRILPDEAELTRAMKEEGERTVAQPYYPGRLARYTGDDGVARDGEFKLRLTFLGTQVCAVTALLAPPHCYAPVLVEQPG